MNDKLASVEPLREKWSAQAVAGDMMERCPSQAPCVAIWIDEKGVVHYSKLNTELRDLAMFASFLQTMTAECICGRQF